MCLIVLSYDFNYETIANNLVKSSVVNTYFNNIVEGKFRFWQTTDCLNILYEKTPFEIRDGCYFQNPDAPYGLILLPPHYNETIDDYYGFPVSDGNLSATWHMKNNEVIILIGITPPECKYFGFSNYLYSRHYPMNWTHNDTKKIINLNCPNSSKNNRCEVFASLDDSINLDRGLNLNPIKYNSSFALILSNNIEATQFAMSALIETGVEPSLISNYSFPGNEMKLGIDTNDDTFITIMRTAFYSDNIDANNYFNQVPFKVIRMELNQEDTTLYYRKELVDRKINYDEASIMGISYEQLKIDYQNIAKDVFHNYIQDKGRNNVYIQITETISGAPDNGFECVNNGTMCLADCRDTLYPFSTKMYKRSKSCLEKNVCYGNMNGTLNNNDTIMVIGFNHVLTKMAMYSSIAIYDAKYLWGVYTIGDKQLENTIYDYISPEIFKKFQHILPYMYIWEFKRYCENIQNCIEIPFYPGLKNNPFIPINNPIAVTERMYNNPVSHVGPYLGQVVLPLVAHVTMIK